MNPKSHTIISFFDRIVKRCLVVLLVISAGSAFARFVSENLVSPPVFSHHGGFYSDTFFLTLSHPDPLVIIVYTLDGSEPDTANLEGASYVFKNNYTFYPDWEDGVMLEDTFFSHIYTEPLLIADRSAEPDKLTHKSTTLQQTDYFPSAPVFKGTMVRARAFREGWPASETITQTFFISSEERERFSLPVVSIALQEDLMFDYQKGIFTPGIDADKWREQNPGVPLQWPFTGNFTRRGEEWEYRGNLEFFPAGIQSAALNHGLGIRIHGGGSRSFPMKSLRLYARSEYGASRFEYPFFQDNPHNRFNRLILRNSGNDFTTTHWGWNSPSRTMFRDAFHQTLVRHLNFDTQDYSPVIVFINGEYWGIHNLRERYDKHYLERVYGVDPDKIDLLTGHSGIQEGTNAHYLETLAFIEENGLVDHDHYQWVQTRIDVENFADYQIANIYLNNFDWPGNNIDFWRYQRDTFEPDSPHGHDGRWRWLMYDTDFGTGLWFNTEGVSHNTLAFATATGGVQWPNPEWSTFLLRNFLDNQDFRHQFINRFADLLNTTFSPSNVISVLDSLKQNIAPEIEEHFLRWASWENLETWEEHIDLIRQFAMQRPIHQRNHIMEHFGLQQIVGVTLETSHPWHGSVRINSVVIAEGTPGVAQDPYPWRGSYFKGVPIEIEALPAPGYVFSHWSGSESSYDPVLILDPDRELMLKAHFVPTGEQTLIHYWLFDDNLPNDTPLEQIVSTFSARGGMSLDFQSCMPGYPYYPGHLHWRRGSMERRNLPTSFNYRPEGNQNTHFLDASMRGIQVKQPLAFGDRESALVLSMSTLGITEPVVRFAAIDEGAARGLRVEFSVTEEPHWIPYPAAQDYLPLMPYYQMYTLHFGQIEQASNNPFLRIRIRFVADYPEAMGANRVTFNNFSLDGVVCMAYRIRVIADGHGRVSPEGKSDCYACGSARFEMFPAENHIIRDVILDGESVLEQVGIDEDRNGVFILPESSADHRLTVVFTYDPLLLYEDVPMVLYPNPVLHNLYVASSQLVLRAELFDLTGRRLYMSDVGNDYFKIDMSIYRNGFYILRLHTAVGVTSRKIQNLQP